MSWIHDCCYTTIPDGSRIKHDLQTRSFGDWITTCPHCGKPKPMTYPERISTLTADLARLTAELEKEKAKSRHLAEAMSRKIDELIASENQCSYYKAQYTRAEQIRKEACEANVKAQAAMLWAKAELERKQRECEGLHAVATQYAASLGFVEPDEKLAKDLAALSAGENDGNA